MNDRQKPLRRLTSADIKEEQGLEISIAPAKQVILRSMSDNSCLVSKGKEHFSFGVKEKAESFIEGFTEKIDG